MSAGKVVLALDGMGGDHAPGVVVNGADIARERGVLLADTKFEFGVRTEAPEVAVLADEVLTPDSSRYWPADQWQPGGPQPSFDKQYVRDWLLSSGWDRASTPPELPEEIVAKTQERYMTAYELLTGKAFI